MLEAQQTKEAAKELAIAPAEQKNRALLAMAKRIRGAAAETLAANRADLDAANHLSEALRGRLTLTAAKVEGLAVSLEQIAALPDPVGEELERIERPNGLLIRKVRVPLGVIGMIYEARPNVTVDAAALCLKAGNGVLLKGGREAYRTNVVLAEQVRQGLVDVGLPAAAVALLGAEREAATALMEAVGYVDALIPRGGPGLIEAVVRQARVPVIQTGAGVCHTYVHASADLDLALAVVANAKLSNPGVCNALETLLVDEAIAPAFLAKLPAVLPGVALWADGGAVGLLPGARPALPDQWGQEYLGLSLSVRVVPGLDAALTHIARWGTGHSEAILTGEPAVARRFQAEVDAAAVYVNASTRFTDGGEFGFGAEMGISTQKLHARGPMGLRELTSYKYLIDGTGQIR